MLKAYLLVFSSIPKTEIKDTLEKMTNIKHWRSDMSNCFYVISESSAQELYEEFISIRGSKGRFIFMEASDNRQGLLTKETWYLLRNKKRKPPEESDQ
ncbi:hypothetical protein ACDX34_21760 [Acinetobacter bereziniae]|uniref:hypothetical protein n=1 Tax=Acinetobacter bereziniae TaxID=106648 RepID=UPI0039C46D9B